MTNTDKNDNNTMRKTHDIFGNWQFFFDDYYAAKSYEISETDESITISFVAPGNKTEDISVELSGKVLNVKTPEQRERSFELPDGVDEENIEATYEAGILKVTLTKKPIKVREIAVK